MHLMAQVRIFSHSLTWIGMAAQIDQIGALINLSRDCALSALRIPCVGDELMGFPEEHLPSIEVIVILGCVSSATRAVTHPFPPKFAHCPCSRLAVIKHGGLYIFTKLSALISNSNILTADAYAFS